MWWIITLIRRVFEHSKLTFALCLLGASGLYWPNRVMADENFATDLKTTYQVNDSGSTTVEHAFTITNRTPTFYINRYGLKLSSRSIQAVAVTFNSKPIPAEVVQDAQFTSIGIEFPDKIVGEGKQLSFTIRYQDPDITQINGQVLEVTIPALANAAAYQRHAVVIKTPLRFGTAIRSTPKPTTQTVDPAGIVTRYDTATSQGISLIFGTHQVFDLNLTYPLENVGGRPIVTQITLPPDTPLQRVYYQSLEPPPTAIKVDADGNWIASYQLKPNTSTEVRVRALAKISLDADPQIPMAAPTYDHFAEKPFWETNATQLKELAASHPNPFDSYQATVETLTYTTAPLTEYLERLGAVAAVDQPDLATCQEYTDLFITLNRINQIPSRRVTGYAHTQNTQIRPVGVVGDILHAWPEYFDQTTKTWIPVDPTWGDTTGGVDYFNQFDLNHVVFAYQGTSSTLPYPAGSYRPGTQPRKLVEVGFGTQFPDVKPNLEIKVVPKKTWFLTWPGYYSLVITNQTGLAWYQLAAIIKQPENTIVKLDLSGQNSQILPYQTLTIPLTAYNMSEKLTRNSPYDLTITQAGQAIASGSATLTVLPRFLSQFSPEAVIICVVASLVALTLIAGSVFILWPKQTSLVRW